MSALIDVLLPTSYSGHVYSLLFLGLCGLMTVVPGLIHHFKHDGGAESIAGLKLGDQRELVIGIFAWLGATQIAWGLLMLIVAVRYQMLTPLLLLLIVLERSLLIWRWWIRRRAVGRRPPEHYVSLVSLPIGLLFLHLAVTQNV